MQPCWRQALTATHHRLAERDVTHEGSWEAGQESSGVMLSCQSSAIRCTDDRAKLQMGQGTEVWHLQYSLCMQVR